MRTPRNPVFVSTSPLVQRAAKAAETVHSRETEPALHYVYRAGWIDGSMSRQSRGTPGDRTPLGSAYNAGYAAGAAALVNGEVPS